MPNDFQRRLDAARRLAILCALYFGPGFRLSARELLLQVEASGFTVSHIKLEADLAWLEETGLVVNGQSPRLTDQGLDVVMGRSKSPGVRPPEPGELDSFGGDRGAS